jgi:molybdate transport system substrate-binding protein
VHVIWIVPLIFVSISACADRNAEPQRVVRVAAASDLTFVLGDLAEAFARSSTNIGVEPTYGSSGNFHAQLRQGAPFDLFLSADVGYPRDLVERGSGREGDLFTYAIGRIGVWVPNGSPLMPELEGLKALAGATRVAIANPRHAPYGRAAEAALRREGLWEELQARLVLGESLAQAAQFVQSGAADAGIVSRSLAGAPGMRSSGRFWLIPEDSHPPILQGGLVLPSGRSRIDALRFRDFLLGPEGRALLAAHGFDPPQSPDPTPPRTDRAVGSPE